MFFSWFRATDDVGLVFLHTWSLWPTTEHESWSVAAPDDLHMTIALIAFKSSVPLSFLATCWAHLSWTPPDCNKWWAGTYVDHYCSAQRTWSQGYTTEALAGQVHSCFFLVRAAKFQRKSSFSESSWTYASSQVERISWKLTYWVKWRQRLKNECEGKRLPEWFKGVWGQCFRSNHFTSKVDVESALIMLNVQLSCLVRQIFKLVCGIYLGQRPQLQSTNERS